ncbi:amidohydrolase [bacterium 3DAC]|nr:amidohydrolase [Dictyoglomota bacterium]UZN22349.1 amidohydrolase [bacterium 3DAC]
MYSQFKKLVKDAIRKADIEKRLDEIITYRRELHQIPEVGLELPKTKAYVEEKLRSFGLEPKHVGPGIVVDFGEPPYVALRADMDALPLQELRDVPYKSKHDGFMHACGHDAHTAVLLGVAHHFAENPPERGVRLVFQPGEEGYFGAKYMVEAGVLENVEVITGAHVGALGWPGVKPGTVISKRGPFMASADEIHISFKGKGTHGSIPHTGIDPIVPAAHYVMAVYNMRARELNQTHPVVITIGEIHGGTTHNIIPEETHMSGTVRTVTPEDRQYIATRLEEIAKSMGKMYKADVEFEYKWGYPPLHNTPEVVDVIEKIAVATEIPYVEAIEPVMGAEDFAYYTQRVPGAFFFVITSNPDKGITAPNHSPYFDIDEDLLWIPFYIFLEFVEVWGK